MGVPVKRVHMIVRELAEARMIDHQPGKPRSIALPRPLAGYSDSELILDLQARGYLVSVTVVPETIQELPFRALLDDLA